MKTKTRTTEIIGFFLSDLIKAISYMLLGLYVISLVFNINLDPSFPLHQEELPIGAVVAGILAISIKLWLLRHK